MARDTRPHRILFLDHAPIIGGGQLSLAEHVRSLDRTRFQPLVACTAAAPALLALYRDAGAEVHVIPLPRLRRVHPLVLPQLVRSVRALRRLVRELDVDIVVASTSRAAYIATLGLTRANVPVVWWVRDFLYNRLVFRLLSPGATRIICVSEAVRAFYRGQNDPRFAVIVVGSTLYRALAGLDDRDVQAERTRWGFSRDDVVVGFMGRLVEEKGPEDVIAAVADLHQRDPRVKLLIVGSGTGQLNSVEERARELVARRGWSFVTFAGFQSDEALYYRLFDVVVLASREHEGYGMSAVQAMMARTPVVATAVGGTPELVRHRETGLLVPPAAPPRIAASITELRDDRALRERLVEAAFTEVMTHNREEITTGRAERLYEEMLIEAEVRRCRPKSSVPA